MSVLRKRSCQLPEILTKLYICIMFSIFLLAFDSSGYSAITSFKFRLFSFITLAYFSLLIISCTVLTLTKSRKFRLAFSAGRLCIFLFLSACIISALFSDYGTDTWQGLGRYEGLFTILLYSGIFISVSLFGEWDDKFPVLLSLTAVILFIISVLQFLNYNPLGLYPGSLRFHSSTIEKPANFLGTIGNANIVSSLMCMLIPLFIHKYCFTENMTRFYWLGISLMCWFMLTIIHVAAGYVAIILTACVYLPTMIVTSEKLKRFLLLAYLFFSLFAVIHNISPLLLVFVSAVFIFLMYAASSTLFRNISVKTYRKMWIVLEVSFSLLFCIAIYFFASPSSGIFYELSQLLRGNISIYFGSSRIFVWEDALHLFREAPILGGGPDTFVARSGAKFYNVGANSTTIYYDFVHNEYLDILVNVGLCGLIPYLSLLVILAFRWFRNKDKNIVFFGLSVLCYCIQAFFSIRICIIAPVYFILLGLLDKKLEDSRAF